MPADDPVFLDTSGLLALLNADDALHALARDCVNQFRTTRRRLLTTDWVLAETGNGLARTSARSRFPEAVRAFLRSPHVRLVRVDSLLFEQALALYQQAGDKTWGLIDCASFMVMRAEGSWEALTADQHFRQAGFQCLLSAP